jgi:hypothetical protein
LRVLPAAKTPALLAALEEAREMVESHDEQVSFAQALMSSGLSSQQLPAQAEPVANVSSFPSPTCLASSSKPEACNCNSLALVEQTENEHLAAALAAAAKNSPAVVRKPDVQADAGSHDDESAREYLRFMLAYRRAAETLGIPSSPFEANSVKTSVPFDLLVAGQEFCSPDEESGTGDFKVVMPHTQTHTRTHAHVHMCTRKQNEKKMQGVVSSIKLINLGLDRA